MRTMLSALMTTTTAFFGASERDDPAGTAELRPLVRAVVACVLRERPDSADVEDCTSEALRRALEKKEDRTGALRPWVLGIARHVALDALRARQRARQRLVDNEVHAGAVPDPAADAEAQLTAAEERERVRAALATLPEGPRRALELFHVEGLPYDAIAARLGVPLGTVATWLSRGRRALTEALQRGGEP